MAIVSVGIDLAKNVFAVHGVDESGKSALVHPNVSLAKLLDLIASLPPEACSGAHHWAREFGKFGHTVRLMAPKFVIPYRLSGKCGKNERPTPPPSAKPSPARNGCTEVEVLLPTGAKQR